VNYVTTIEEKSSLAEIFRHSQASQPVKVSAVVFCKSLALELGSANARLCDRPPKNEIPPFLSPTTYPYIPTIITNFSPSP